MSKTYTAQDLGLTDEQFDIADRIELWLEAHPGKLHNRSTIARGDYNEVEVILHWMDKHYMVAADGNGCWRKYGERSMMRRP
jgi:hypothetical protein